MKNYRTPIGFKVTDNKLQLNNTVTNNTAEFGNDAKTIALLQTLQLIDKEMSNRAKSVVKHQRFTSHPLDELLSYLDKLYIRHYEPL